MTDRLDTPPRAGLLRRALLLEILTVGWNIIEGVIAITAALAAGSVALLGFGIDSFVESFSGGILLWRLRAERQDMSGAEIERLDRGARKLVATAGGDIVKRSGAPLRIERVGDDVVPVGDGLIPSGDGLLPVAYALAASGSTPSPPGMASSPWG